MTIFINPGTGPVPEATTENAVAAMRLLVADLRANGHTVTQWTRDDDPQDGRWSFKLVMDDGRAHEIEIPGCDPELTRRSEPWVSPRLYVDGSSWLWEFALQVIAGPSEQDES